MQQWETGAWKEECPSCRPSGTQVPKCSQKPLSCLKTPRSYLSNRVFRLGRHILKQAQIEVGEP